MERAVLLWRPYLENTRFTNCTDHDSLKRILNLTDVTVRLARWRLRLTEYKFDIFHRAGIEYQAADALSRLQATGKYRTPLGDDLTILAIDITLHLEEICIIDACCEEVLPLNAQSPPSNNTPPSAEEMIFEQVLDHYCRVAVTRVAHFNFEFTVDKKTYS